MKRPLRALIVEDNERDIEIMVRDLDRGGYDVVYGWVQTAEAMRAALAAEPWDVILSDYALPQFSAPEALNVVKESGSDIPFLIVSGTIGEETAVASLKAGAHDFLVKGRLARLAPAIERALREAENRRQRREAMAKVEESDRRLRAIFHQVAVGVVQMDLEARLVAANQRFCDIVGRPVAAVTGRRMSEMVHLDDGAVMAEVLARVAGGEASGDVETRYVLPDASHVFAHHTISAVADRDGRPTYMVAIVQDITERKRAEALRLRGLELEAENRRIQEANRIKSEFLANMSHELRTPLNSIIGFAEIMHDGRVGDISPQHKDFLCDILTSARHLLHLINDILDLSKVEAGKLEFHPEVVDVGRIVAEVAALLRSAVAEKRIRLVTDVDRDLASVAIDAARLKQVLYNYLSNALKFTLEGGTVTARARVEDASTFRIEVEDTGIGIAAGDIANLFVAFQQVDSEVARRQRGTGLGLALTKRLVEAQGGSVGVRSEQGRGSTFWALLPRRARSGVALPEPRVVPGPRPDAPVVLVVEDDARDQALLIRTLSEAGYAVETAASRAQALARWRDRRYDAITLDLLLPDGSGFEILQGIRAGGKNADVPVIVVSVVADTASLAGFALHDALSKPLDPERLLASLTEAGVAPGRDGHILVVDDDIASLQLMEATLGELGYRATCVSEGERGLAHAIASRPLAVVLDLMMPGMNGFEFLERFRRTAANRDVPVIIWTIKDLSPEKVEILRASAQAVVKKDAAGAEALLRELGVHLRAGPGSRRTHNGTGSAH